MKYFNYRGFFTKEHVRSLCTGLFFLLSAIIFQSYASAYVAKISSNYVSDLFLTILPVVNLNWLIIEGALLAIVISFLLIFAKPKYLLFTIKAGAIFIATRAIFIMVTHIGIYPGQVPPGIGWADNIYTDLGLQTGFFFSGHTGLPLLMAMIFWNEKFWRYAYIALAVVFGIAVLLSRVHYTIDVLAAPYMTYGIYKMSEYFFPEDWKMIEG